MLADLFCYSIDQYQEHHYTLAIEIQGTNGKAGTGKKRGGGADGLMIYLVTIIGTYEDNGNSITCFTTEARRNVSKSKNNQDIEKERYDIQVYYYYHQEYGYYGESDRITTVSCDRLLECFGSQQRRSEV